METKSTLARILTSLALCLCTTFTLNLRAATWWWDGNASTANSASDNSSTNTMYWLSGGNWDNGSSSAPLSSWSAGDSAIFGGTSANQIINAGTLTIGNMTFGQGPQATGTNGTAYTITGGAITLSAGSLITNNTTTVISSPLSGGGLTKWGTNVLTLGGNNTYIGNTAVNAGQVVVKNSSGLGSGNVTLGAAGTLTFASTSALTVANNISITPGGQVVSGQGGATGALTLNGTITLNASGNCYVGSGVGIPSVTLNGQITGSGTLYINNPYEQDGSLGTITKAHITATNNNYTGGTWVANGAWGLYGSLNSSDTVTLYASSLGSGNIDVGSVGDALLVFKADNAVQPGSFLRLHGSAWNQVYFSAVYLNGHSQTVAGLANVGTDNSNLLKNNGASDATLTVNQSTDTTFNGAISDGAAGKFLLAKSGPGTLTLSGKNVYTGATTVSDGGSLLINSPGSLGAGSTVTVNAAGTLGGNGTINGPVLVACGGILSPGANVNAIGTLTLANSGVTALSLTNATLLCDLSNNTTPACDVIAITGTLNLNGASVVSLSTPLGTAPAGTYTLMTYAAKSGSGTLALDCVYPNTTLTVGTTSVTLTVSGSGMWASYVWKGDGTANAWDTATANWRIGSSAVTYTDGSGVTFNDNGSTTPPINITTTVSPLAVKVASSNSFTIGGLPIAGSGSLTKSGRGTLTLSGANTYTGGTIINNGTLQLGTNGTAGSVAGSIVDYSQLAFNRSDSFTFTNSVSGNGSLLKLGTNALTMVTTNSYSGGTTVNAGSLQTSTNNVFGTGAITVNNGGNLWFNPTEASPAAINCTNVVNLASGAALYAGPAAYTTAGEAGYVAQGAVTDASAVNITGTATIGSSAGTPLVFSGPISGSGTLTVSCVPGAMASGTAPNYNPGYSLIYLTSPGNNWTGGTTILKGNGSNYGGANDANRVYAASLGGGPVQLGSATDNYASGGFLYLTAANAINPGSAVTMFDNVNSAYYSQVQLNGFSQTIAGLASGGSGGTYGQYCKVVSASGSPTLMISNSTDYTFNGVISNGLSLLKAGSGTQALSGTNSFTGSTTVNGGALLINSPGSLAAGSTVTVNTSGILGGSGTVNGPVLVASGGIVSPGTNGSASSTLALANSGATALSLTNATLQFDLSINATPTCDLVAVTGTLNLNGASVVSLSTPLGSAPAGTYTLMTYGAKSGSGSLTLDHVYTNASLTVGATSVTLTVSGSGTWGSYIWKGDGTANAWDRTTANWLVSGAAATYTDGNAVTFNDAGSNTPAISITAGVFPGSVKVVSTNNYTISGSPIGGSGSLFKSGTGTLILANSNSYTGGTIINNGAVQLGNNGTKGSVAGNIANYGQLDFYRNDNGTFTNPVSGYGSMMKLGTNALTIAATNSYSGGTSVSGGSLRTSGNGAFGSGTVVVNLNANLWFNPTETSAAAINYANALNLASGAALFAGPASYTTAGESHYVAQGAVTNSGAVSITGTVTLGSSARTPLPFSGPISGSGTLVVDHVPGAMGSGNSPNYHPGYALIYLTNPGNNWTGGTTIMPGNGGYYGGANDANWVYAASLGSGPIQLGSPSAGSVGGGFLYLTAPNAINPGSTVTLYDSVEYAFYSQLDLNGFSQTMGGLVSAGSSGTYGQFCKVLSASGSPSLTISNNANYTFNGVIASGLSLVKSGFGAQTLANTNTYTGATTVNGGALVIGGAGQLGSGSYGAAITNSGTFNYASSANQTLSGVISGSGFLMMSGAGTLTLSGINTCTGGTTISGGTLVVGSAGQLGSGSYAGAITNNSVFNYASSANQTLSGAISGTGALTMSGSGTLTLSGANTYTGATTISAGTLAVSGNGTIGTSSNLTIAAGATLDASGATGGCTLGAGQSVVGTGATGSLKGPLTLNSAALAFTYTNGVPTWNVVSGTLSLSSNATTVIVLGSTPLALGSYKIISKTGGTVAGNVSNAVVVVNGAGSSGSASLQIVNGELYLNLQNTTPTTTTITSSSVTQAYGKDVTFTATVSPSVATGVATFSDGTTTYGPFALVNGQTAFTLTGGSLNVGAYPMTATYYGTLTYMPSTSAVLTQTITRVVLTVSANNVSRWVGHTNPVLTASYIGFVADDTTSILSGAPSLSTTATPASPIGSYPITIAAGTLVDTSGNYTLVYTNGTLSVIARAMAYPQGTAFPMMMYQVEITDIGALACYGWNIMQMYGSTTSSALNADLQAADSNSVAADVVIPSTTDTSGNIVELPQAQVQAWIQGLAGNNNIGWWDVPEELLGTTTEIQMLQDYRTWVHLYDTNGQRPIYEVTYIGGLPAGIVTNVDIIGMECYAVGQGTDSHTGVRAAVEAAIQSVAQAGATLGPNYMAGQKTVEVVFYCANQGEAFKNLPTPQECYHDFWSAIASGAQGVEVFAYYQIFNDNTPALVTNLAQYNLAASQVSGSDIGPAVLFGTRNSNVTFTVTSGPTTTDKRNYPSLNVLCKTWSNAVYVIAVNSTSNALTADITNLPPTSATATLPFELRSVTISGNGFTETFPPWGVHVYKTAVVQPPPRINSITIAAGTATLGCSGTANSVYVLQRSTNIVNGSGWGNVATNTASGAGVVWFTNSSGADQVFYRLLAQPGH